MKKKILLLFAILAMAVSASAYDFKDENDTGVTIYYNILEGGTSVEVTSGDSKYTGSVTIPSTVTYENQEYSVTSIGDYAFYNCTGLTSVTIPNSVTSIGNYAFYNTGLTTVDIPTSVTTIGTQAFTSCKSLKSFTGNFASDGGRCLIDNKTLIAFAPAGLTSYKIPDGVTMIGQAAFYSFKNLTWVTIPNSVKTIETNAFANCYGLTSMVIPSSVTTIGAAAFSWCTGLTEIFSLNTTVPTTTSNPFYKVPDSCKVIVPNATAVTSYKGNQYWEAFTNITAGYIYTDDIPYKNSNEVTGCNAYYIRNFTHTGWQALFLPFAMNYSDWSDKGTVAELTGVSSEGVLLWTTIESGSTVAGKPYIFKPNAAGNVTFSVSSATLKVCTDITPVTYEGYTLNGTYTEKTDMADTKAYALSNGNFYFATDNSQTLKPYRIFLTVPESVYAKKAPIRSSINGEGTTEIEGIDVDFDFDADSHQQINLFGQPVGNDYKGIVIVNGKKIIRK